MGKNFESQFSAYGEVTIRPAYADWHGGDLFIMIHTNAGGGTGTVSFVHDTSPTAGSEDAMQAAHDHVVADIRKVFDPAWSNRGYKTANFGELRVINTMPAYLIEIAFHDNAYDAALERDDKFRNVVCRAITKGAVDFFAPGTVYAPVPPSHVRALNQANGEVKIAWQPGADPTVATAVPVAYRVQLSRNGKGFDAGWLTNDDELVFAGMTPGDLYFARVTAINAGGESPPSSVVAFRVGSPTALIVDGFDRLDERINIRQRRQTYDFSIQHAQALAQASQQAFDGCQNEAVESGAVDLGDYAFVDWILGEESTQDETLSATEQQALTAYLNGGGALFISGSELTWDLDNRGNTADKAFIKDFLKCGYGADDANSYQISASTALGTSAFTFANATSTPLYPVEYPDVLSVQGGEVLLTYGSGATAGVGYKGSFKVVSLGFPFETITTPAQRAEVMGKILQYCQ